MEIGKVFEYFLCLICNCFVVLLLVIVDWMVKVFKCEVLFIYVMIEFMFICSLEVGKGLFKCGFVGCVVGLKVIIGDVKLDGKGKLVLSVLEFYVEGEVMV